MGWHVTCVPRRSIPSGSGTAGPRSRVFATRAPTWVRAAARRGARPLLATRAEPLEIDGLRIEPSVVQAFVDGESLELTPTEFRLLHMLALERGRVVTRDELLQALWGRRHTYRDRTVDVLVRKLREKIDRRTPDHTFIHTRYGVGYRFEPVAKEFSATGP